MRVIVDTGVFFLPEALEDLARLPHDVIVPAAASTERARQLQKRSEAPAVLRDALAVNEMVVEPYGVVQAERYAVHVNDDEVWRRIARDAMIAGHLEEDDVLWTTNPKDFHALGVPEDQVVAVPAD